MVSHLKYIVMRNLCEGPMSGYSLMKRIVEETGCWKPSPGSIYPLLGKLSREKFVIIKKDGRKKIYSITKKGSHEFDDMRKKKNVIINHLIAHWNIFSSLEFKKSESKIMLNILKKSKDGNLPFTELEPEVGNIKSILLNLYTKKDYKDNIKSIKKILNDALIKLRQLK